MIDSGRQECVMTASVSRGADGERIVYLDYNATAPLRPEALDAMLPHLQDVGNAASPHAAGRRAAASVEAARRQLASLLGCSPGELIFTSGATEANNLALRAGVAAHRRLVTTAVEHPAVLHTAHALSREHSTELTVLTVDRDGLLDLNALEEALASHDTTFVSVMTANNETGVLFDLKAIVEICHAHGALVHTDATQLVGRSPVDLTDLDVDLLSLSAHKFGGPQGVGALFLRRDTPLPHHPLLHGGGQERGWRGGTLNVAGIVSTGAAAAAAAVTLSDEAKRVESLRDRLETTLLSRLEGGTVNGDPYRRLPGVSSLTFPGVPADAALAAMPTVAASDGSACASGAPSPSHVLLAMGHSRDEAECTLRLSLGYATTETDVDEAIETIVDAITRVRSALDNHSPSGVR